ncbi:ATP-binding protein [Nocardiopsis sp. LDBS1602]|uniref:ATP-binding protein n=1 Tax=Nocardiopsis sp. LDBS1602 TaxID=3109597 RepID=UPI002DBA8970|nr:ATP-binding protein [Nocardiopsis sp. LDBS1602]MEC3891829.1 ATP-binding protein [Nocardiopsis sp. LDBS1602]
MVFALLNTMDPIPVLEDALVVTSEPVSNAILEGIRTRSAPIGLTVHLADNDLLSLTVEVTNPHNETVGPFQQQNPAPDSEHGRGLLIVDTCTDSWGTRLDEAGRLVVWATWSWRSPALRDQGWLAERKRPATPGP